MKKIKVKSPTRVDFAGGTLDLWPIYNFFEDCKTLNLAISIFTEVHLDEKNSGICLEVPQLNLKKDYKSLEDCLLDQDESLILLREHIRFWKPKMGFHLKTFSESPIGAGLGGSSSLSVSLFRAFQKFCEEDRPSFPSLPNIEAKVLFTPTGVQDYYPPLYGGFLTIHLNKDFHEVEKHEIPRDILDSFLLIYTGKPHHSGLNNWQVLKAAVEKDQQTLQDLEALRDIALSMHQSILAKDFSSIPLLLQEEFKVRSQISASFTSPEIEKLHQEALMLDCQATKICGAGGGGCVMLWCKETKKESTQKLLREKGYQVLDAVPVEQGSVYIET